MKYIAQYKSTMVLVVLLMGMIQARAQEFRTDESISSQLRKGTAPGLKYGPASSEKVRPADDKQQGQESTINQIRKKTLKGMRFAEGGGAARSVRPAARTSAAGGSLPSEQRAVTPPPAAVHTPSIPAQGGVVDPGTGPVKVSTPAGTEKKETPAKTKN